MHTKALFFLLVYCAICHFSWGQPFKSKDFQVKKLTPNVYAAIATPGGGAICNAGVIDLGNEVLVFDPFLTPAAAEQLKNFITLKIKKPVRWVVDSHAHNDHVRGNQVFPSATIVSTVLTREMIAKTEPLDIADEKTYVPGRIRYYDSLPLSKDKWQAEEDAIWRGYYKSMGASYKTLKTVLPNLLFTESLTIYGNNTLVKLISYGDGHTPSDLFLYLPKEKIVFTGDLLFVNYHPWIAESKMQNWIDYLQKMKTLDVQTYIPGHGPEGKPKDLTDMIDYFNALTVSTEKLRGQSNLTNEQINAQMPPAYKGWHLRNFYALNIKYLLKN